MKKRFILYFAIFLIALTTIPAPIAFAAESNNLDIEIISPMDIEDKPIYDVDIQIRVKNLTEKAIENLDCYIIVVDTVKNMSLPMDEFGTKADYTRQIDKIDANGYYDLTIPVRFMYTGTFKLTACVMDQHENYVVTSLPLTATMLVTSRLNKTAVMVVAIVVPVLLSITAVWMGKRNKQKK